MASLCSSWKVIVFKTHHSYCTILYGSCFFCPALFFAIRLNASESLGFRHKKSEPFGPPFFLFSKGQLIVNFTAGLLRGRGNFLQKRIVALRLLQLLNQDADTLIFVE